MKTFFATLLDKVKDHPVAKAVAIIGLAVWGGGYTLSETQIEPWGTIVQGIGASLGAIAGFIVLFSKKEPPK